MIACIHCCAVLNKSILIYGDFWTKSVVLHIIMRLLIVLLWLNLLCRLQNWIIVFSISVLNVIEIWQFLLWKFTHWISLHFIDSAINTFLCLHFFHTTTCNIFVSISLRSWWIWFASSIRNFFEKRRTGSLPLVVTHYGVPMWHSNLIRLKANHRWVRL